MDRQAANSGVEASEVWKERGRGEQQVFTLIWPITLALKWWWKSHKVWMKISNQQVRKLHNTSVIMTLYCMHSECSIHNKVNLLALWGEKADFEVRWVKITSVHWMSPFNNFLLPTGFLCVKYWYWIILCASPIEVQKDCGYTYI